MAPELIYMLKANVGIALFYAFYKLFCCRDTFFRWRRTALMSFLILSFLYPLLNIQTWVKKQPAMNELADYYALLIVPAPINEVAATTTSTPIPTPGLMGILFFIYLGGVCLLSIRFAIQLCSIFHLLAKSKKETVNGITVRNLDTPVGPFSFFQWIFVHLPEIKENSKQEILTHELTHARQWHSIDVIIAEIANIICWMNPFIWLLKTEIRLNLEYLADHTVINSVADTRQYQYHLLGLANQYKPSGLYNNFNVSHLKNRITMMNKKRTRTAGCIKYALFAPLIAALLLISNIEVVARTAKRLVTPAEAALPTAGAYHTAIEDVPPIALETVAPQDTTIYSVVEEPPQFPGGSTECFHFIAKNLEYPKEAEKRKIEGNVIVKLIIDQDGHVTNVKIARGIDPLLDNEALRIVNSMPKWEPGKHRGKTVKCRFVLPVKFKLDGTKTPDKQ